MKYLLLCFLLLITGSLLKAQPSNDNFANAADLDGIMGGCSADEAYTTSGATADGSSGSCFDTHNYNVWFSFTAIATEEVTVTIDRGGIKGTIEKVNVAIWESDGTTQVACTRYSGNRDDVSLFTDALTSGNTYYISVDNKTSSKRGTFTICLDDGAGSSATNDEIADAYDITSLIGSCSGDAVYDNTGATADGSAGSCWDTHAYNVWFKFTAPVSGNIQLTVDVGGGKGTLERVNMALWESDASTELACAKYSSKGDDVTITHSGLTPGNLYYLSVDNKTSSSSGSFSICADDLDIFYSISDGNWNTASTWSHDGHSGSATTLTPSSGCIVHIKGNDVSVNIKSVCDSLLVDVGTNETTLILNEDLTVESNMYYRNTGVDINGSIEVSTGGVLNTTDLNIIREGGANSFGFTVSTGGVINVTNLNVTSSGGSTSNSTLTLEGTADFNISNDLSLNSTGGTLIKLQADGSSTLNVSNNINFNASTSGQIEIELNSTSIMSIGGAFSRSSSFGTLDMNGSSILEFNGSSSQIIPSVYGAGGDDFSYQSIKINNTNGSRPQISLSGPVFVNGNFDLTDGVVESTSANRVFIMDGGTVSNASTSSHVQGPITKVGDEAFTFPTGKDGIYAPIGMSAPSSAFDYFTAEYYRDNPGSMYDGNSKDANIESLSTSEYWTLDRDLGSSNVSVTMYTNASRSDSLASLENYIVCRWNGTSWEDHGNSSFTGDNQDGTVTSNAITSFSPFTFGKSSNPVILPVELIEFTASEFNEEVNLEWITASEINNDYFEIQRSIDLSSWETIGEVQGSGNTAFTNYYNYVDKQPVNGISYYRLKQVDFDGQFELTEARVVSVEKNPLSSFKVYPNPAHNQLFVSGVSEDDIIRIFNINGQELVLDRKSSLETGVELIYLDHLLSGTYLVYFNGDVHKFIKE